ncbi:MAG: glutathione S-transferase [Gammaproteobacteria bacterium]|nr:MAG: glutathione S-transferase [Gammaproteobacteria bacterium]
MSKRKSVRLKGAPGSPYTRKMLALLRYRRIPYEFLIGNQADDLGLPKPKVELLPTFYLPNASGEIEAVVDSTPLIRRFERDRPDRSVIPPDPALAFIDALLEDYADEWLTKAMFHYRWWYEADIDKAASILPLWRDPFMSPETHERMRQFIAERQIARLYVVGSNAVTAPVIEASYVRFLDLFEALLQRQPFLMGQRPGSGDFGIYAQLTQLAKFDPTPMALALERAPRVCAWVDAVDDLSGHPAPDSGWLANASAREVLGGLLAEVGRVYVPALLANAKALESGEKQWHTTIDGQRWEQPTFPYQVKCLQSLREAHAALDASAKRTVAGIIDGTGCEALLKTG